jgi:REP element-mobilizing transposase RayT
MSRKYKFGDSRKLYFVSYATVNWIDVFIRNEYRNIMLNSFRYCQEKKGLEIYAYCIMTSHIHMIISSEQNRLENIIRDLKSYTSTQMRSAIDHNPIESRKEWMMWMMKRAGLKNSNNNDYQFWQQNNHPIELYNFEMTKQKLDYIHNNPVEAGFVSKPEDWLYSSAQNYCGMDSLIDVILIFG